MVSVAPVVAQQFIYACPHSLGQTAGAVSDLVCNLLCISPVVVAEPGEGWVSTLGKAGGFCFISNTCMSSHAFWHNCFHSLPPGVHPACPLQTWWVQTQEGLRKPSCQSWWLGASVLLALPVKCSQPWQNCLCSLLCGPHPPCPS
jgi:hypothetical protein